MVDKSKSNIMGDLSKLFYSISQDNTHLSSYVCLLKTLDGKGVKQKMCEFYFENLVDKADYNKEDKEELIKDLVRVSKPLI